jgi:hypothetical protein
VVQIIILFKMRHFFIKHWVILAAFALSFLLTIFISPENAVIAQSTVSTVSDGNNDSATKFNEDMSGMAGPSLDFGF